MGFDDQIFTLQRHGGISRYFTELLQQFAADPSLGVSLAREPIWTLNSHLLDAGMGRRLPGPLGGRPRALQAANRLPRRGGETDVMHHTFYVGSYLDRTIPGRRVVTVYDMIPELYPELFPHGNPHLDKRAFVEAADLVLCISDATRRDLVSVYGEHARVMVTPLGVNPLFRPGGPALPGLPETYILFVGNRSGYKDFLVLAEALAELGDRDLHLVAVGGGPLAQAETGRLTELKLQDRVHQASLDDAGLNRAYGNARAFVFPSRHEGFGLPTLEAMAAGCPTILVDSSSHPEVGGTAAAYFRPGDVGELTEILRAIVQDDDRRAEMKVAGLSRAATFTWSRTALLTAEAYRAAMARP